MSEQEILQLQAENGQQEFYMVLVGRFMHAYGNGAFALSRATGYRVIRKRRKSGEVLTAGFPIDLLNSVLSRIREHGGTARSLDERIWLFGGVDGTPDCGWLVDAVRSFNLTLSTPMEAMLFIGQLQRQISDSRSQ